MAIARVWITVTPLGRPLAQAAIDLVGLGGEISLESWTAYPSEADPKLYRIGWQGELTTLTAIELALLNVVGVHTRRGPVRPSNPAMTAAQLMAAFPLPLSGPTPDVIVTQKAATRAHYRDHALGAFDDDGSPGLVANAEAAGDAGVVFSKKKGAAVAATRGK